MPRVAPRLTANARALRSGATAEERLVWARLRQVRPRITRQLPVGPYILDFACRSLRIAVEIDGGQHGDAEAYDSRRTAFLEGLGWLVLRFWNSDVRDNPDGVAETILAAVTDRLGPTYPDLSFRKRA